MTDVTTTLNSITVTDAGSTVTVDIGTWPAAHATTHGAGGYDPITSLGTVAVTSASITAGTITTGTVTTLTAGTATFTGASIGAGTVTTLTAGAATMTSGTATTFTASTASITSGTVTTLTAGTTTFTGVQQHALGAVGAPSVTFTGDTNTGIYSPGADQVAISTAGTARLYVGSTGKVGVQTSTPTTTVGISGSGYDGICMEQRTDAASASTGIYFVTSTSGNPAIRADAGGLSIYTGAVVGSSGGTQRLLLDANGVITGTGTSLGAWTAYTPTLTASTTDPALGTGATSEGYYMRIGKLVIARFAIIFGSSMNAGSGTYRIALPVARSTSGSSASRRVAHIFMYDSSAGNVYTNGVGEISDSGDYITNIYYGNGTTLAAVSNSAPWTWAQSDQITGSFVYQAA